ncbi:BA75_01128T0 [Komagataella pastoris]|uniref:BA75_01128T0 n=1 Tax=Komagataella pastoris TaxID=4922 RepID=A0A1B2J6M8_PICPA|nr:BA75_01128T0 [Komagataella pastoris]
MPQQDRRTSKSSEQNKAGTLSSFRKVIDSLIGRRQIDRSELEGYQETFNYRLVSSVYLNENYMYGMMFGPMSKKRSSNQLSNWGKPWRRRQRSQCEVGFSVRLISSCPPQLYGPANMILIFKLIYFLQRLGSGISFSSKRLLFLLILALINSYFKLFYLMTKLYNINNLKLLERMFESEKYIDRMMFKAIPEVCNKLNTLVSDQLRLLIIHRATAIYNLLPFLNIDLIMSYLEIYQVFDTDLQVYKVFGCFCTDNTEIYDELNSPYNSISLIKSTDESYLPLAWEEYNLSNLLSVNNQIRKIFLCCLLSIYSSSGNDQKTSYANTQVSHKWLILSLSSRRLLSYASKGLSFLQKQRILSTVLWSQISSFVSSGNFLNTHLSIYRGQNNHILPDFQTDSIPEAFKSRQQSPYDQLIANLNKLSSKLILLKNSAPSEHTAIIDSLSNVRFTSLPEFFDMLDSILQNATYDSPNPPQAPEKKDEEFENWIKNKAKPLNISSISSPIITAASTGVIHQASTFNNIHDSHEKRSSSGLSFNLIRVISDEKMPTPKTQQTTPDSDESFFLDSVVKYKLNHDHRNFYHFKDFDNNYDHGSTDRFHRRNLFTDTSPNSYGMNQKDMHSEEINETDHTVRLVRPLSFPDSETSEVFSVDHSNITKEVRKKLSRIFDEEEPSEETSNINTTDGLTS